MKVKVTIGQRSGKRLALQQAGLLPDNTASIWNHLEEDGDPKLILRCRKCGAKADCFIHGRDDWWPATEPAYCSACGARNPRPMENMWIIVEPPTGDQLKVQCSDCKGFFVAHDHLMPPNVCPMCGIPKKGGRFKEGIQLAKEATDDGMGSAE